MSALARKSSATTYKRKADQLVSASKSESGLSNGESYAVLNHRGGSDPDPKAAPILLERDQIVCSQYSPGLGADVPLGHVDQCGTGSKNTDAELAEARSDCNIHSISRSPHTDLDDDPLKAQLRGRVTGPCADDESLAIRYHARESGLERCFQEFVVQRRVPLSMLCTAFGVPPPAVPSDPPDKALRNRLKRAMAIDMGNRIKLQQYNSVPDAIALLRNARKIMVITGAGISTSLSIPDFRSRGGLYQKLREMGFEEPENIFSRDTFEQDPRPFFSVASMILPPTDGRFTPAHAFLRLLQDKGRLLTLYTQNVDGIDTTAGIRRDKLVQLHGSFETATCISCGFSVKGEDIFPQIRNGEVPDCARCAKERQRRAAQLISMRAQNGRSIRQRTQRSGINSTTESAGIMRPDIVFMGEPPKPYLKRFKRDCAQVDLVMVMGTSLPVEPVSSMPNHIPPNIPQIYIGKNQMCPEGNKRIDFDIQLLGECDVVAELLAKGCGWDLKHEMLPRNTTIEIEPWCGLRHCHLILRESTVAKREDEETKPDGLISS